MSDVCGAFPSTSNSAALSGYPTIYLDSDTMHLSECTVRSHSLRAQSQETATGFTCQFQAVDPQITLNFCRTWL